MICSRVICLAEFVFRSFLYFLLALISSHSLVAQNPIVNENNLPGNPSSEWDIDGA